MCHSSRRGADDFLPQLRERMSAHRRRVSPQGRRPAACLGKTAAPATPPFKNAARPREARRSPLRQQFSFQHYTAMIKSSHKSRSEGAMPLHYDGSHGQTALRLDMSDLHFRLCHGREAGRRRAQAARPVAVPSSVFIDGLFDGPRPHPILVLGSHAGSAMKCTALLASLISPRACRMRMRRAFSSLMRTPSARSCAACRLLVSRRT